MNKITLLVFFSILILLAKNVQSQTGQCIISPECIIDACILEEPIPPPTTTTTPPTTTTTLPPQPTTYRVWSQAPALITVGKPVQVQIYILKTSAGADSYQIIPQVTDVRDELGNQVPNLVSVLMPSNRINDLSQNELGNTFATVVALGKIETATITFTIDPDIDPDMATTTVQFESGIPISLPEFGLLGLISLILFSLIIFKKVKLKY